MNQSYPNKTSFKIAFIQARWHSDVVDEARKSFIAELSAKAGANVEVEIFDVPGAYEIPFMPKPWPRLENTPLSSVRLSWWTAAFTGMISWQLPSLTA